MFINIPKTVLPSLLLFWCHASMIKLNVPCKMVKNKTILGEWIATLLLIFQRIGTWEINRFTGWYLLTGHLKSSGNWMMLPRFSSPGEVTCSPNVHSWLGSMSSWKCFRHTRNFVEQAPEHRPDEVLYPSQQWPWLSLLILLAKLFSLSSKTPWLSADAWKGEYLKNVIINTREIVLCKVGRNIKF